MQRVQGFVLAVYNFFVGDPVILTGVVALFVIVGLLAHAMKASAGLGLGVVLVAGVILSQGLSLYRETQPKKK
jgi:hypothetical protein